MATVIRCLVVHYSHVCCFLSILLSGLVTTLWLKSLQWLPRFLDEDEHSQLNILLSARSGLHYQTGLILATPPSHFALKSLRALLGLLNDYSEDFGPCYSFTLELHQPLLSVYLAHPDSAITSQFNHHLFREALPVP